MKGNVHIIVVGKENVGKTAIVVRYLTGRYLTEYAHAPEMTYERTVVVDGKQVPLKITDISGKHLEARTGSKDLLAKVDGIVVVYAVDDAHSFQVAEGVCDWVRRDRKSATHAPIVLLGNKADLDHSRSVTCQQTEELHWRQDTTYMSAECSASTEHEDINNVFTALISKILEKRETTLKPRRLSQNPLGSPKIIRATLKRRFSVFTRERTSTM
ncbi:ras-related and estrogen-regulated growth inhibitor-like [Mya arenaria]|uniref:ras-related and estrogen-regulated growth inhibitor-like n=1 Tax=Mya arenaria TaxID=6604 RepID=UPI0022E34A99|nr:ras-related and estrogen-regulated growth inhibitor-like [Mya arenaria]